MRLKILALSALFTVSAGLSGASAAVINFAEEAKPANGGERGLENGEIFTSSNGLSIRLTSGGVSTDGSNKVPAPYLDDVAGGKPAGLGVCTLESGPGSECERSDEDNVTGDQSEFIELGFLDDSGERMFSLDGISFRDADHDDISDSSDLLQISVNGGPLITLSFAEVVAAAAAGAYVNAETLRFVAISLANGGREFYINTVSNVPIPGALPLLLSGLAGLGFASRRRKQTA